MKLFKSGDMKVQTVMIKDQLWFVASDLAEFCGVSKCRMRAKIKELDEDEKMKFWVPVGKQAELFPLGKQAEFEKRGNPNKTLVTEAGLYSLILSCPKSRQKGTSAHAFRRFVTHEVLPSIRKTGEFKLSQLQEQNTRLTSDNAQLRTGNEQLATANVQLTTNNVQLTTDNAAVRRELQYVETNRLYFVGLRIPAVRTRHDPFNFIKQRSRLFRHLLVWRNNVPYIVRGRRAQVVAILSQP